MALQPGLARQLAEDVRDPSSLSFASITGWRDAFRQLKFVQRRIGLPQGPIVWKVGTPVHYSIYQEFGTSMFPPQPYMRPAIKKVIGNPDKYAGDADDMEEYIKKLALGIESEASDMAPVDTGNLAGSIQAVRIT